VLTTCAASYLAAFVSGAICQIVPGNVPTTNIEIFEAPYVTYSLETRQKPRRRPESPRKFAC